VFAVGEWPWNGVRGLSVVVVFFILVSIDRSGCLIVVLFGWWQSCNGVGVPW